VTNEELIDVLISKCWKVAKESGGNKEYFLLNNDGTTLKHDAKIFAAPTVEEAVKKALAVVDSSYDKVKIEDAIFQLKSNKCGTTGFHQGVIKVAEIVENLVHKLIS
jgi:hypothetical protein